MTKLRLASLHQHNLAKYERLLSSLRSTDVICGDASSQAKTLLEATRIPLPPAEDGLKTPLVEEEKVEVAQEAAPILEKPASDVTLPLRESLKGLCDLLSSYSSQKDSVSTTLPEPTAAQSLQKSLESLSSFISNESFYASTPSYPSSTFGYSYAAGSKFPTRSGMDRDKLVQVKNDIRSLKGMFLTR